MEVVVYSADSQLRSLRTFLSESAADLRVAPRVAWRLFLRSLRASYRRSWLGYLWLFLPPVAITATWVYLNSAGIFRVGQTGLPYPIYVLTGTLLWQVFADALQSPLQQLSSARSILTKSRTPHEALLLAGIIEVLFNFVLRLLVLVPAFLWFGSQWPVARKPEFILLVPIGVAALMLLGFSIGLLLTPLGLLYQDVSRGLGIAAGFWFFLTPVIYPNPVAGAGWLVLRLNPVTPLIDVTRLWLTFGSSSKTGDAAFVLALTLPVLIIGWLINRLARPHVVARLG
jgi:lipopolysaccharide transport system permease protein